MQYVRSISGSVSKTWNSINPATLSGAIDVIVVEQEDGSLSCSPFHVRFGKFSLLRPYEKKVEFRVNDVRQDYAMKLGEGGEAFFVFETLAAVPEALQTSPLVSPAASPETHPMTALPDSPITEPEYLDLDGHARKHSASKLKVNPVAIPLLIPERRSQSENGSPSLWQSLPENHAESSSTRRRAGSDMTSRAHNTFTAQDSNLDRSVGTPDGQGGRAPTGSTNESAFWEGSSSLTQFSKDQAVTRAMALSEKLKSSNIPTKLNDQGDLMLDMTGYKSTEEESLRAEDVARQILSEELKGNYDIGSLIGADEKGNLWIYSSEEAKDAATRRANRSAFTAISEVSLAQAPAETSSDPGYHSDDNLSQKGVTMINPRESVESDSAVGLSTPPLSPNEGYNLEYRRTYAKTLRLTSDQLKLLNLKQGANSMSFSVNRATCHAYMYLWRHDTPIVISDIDGTITKSDALGHVLNMIGRDWTHLGVAKLYSDIVANGYNILYLTSRSVGQADTTRAYINGINQDGHRLPKGPVIMSPDRTIAALRREIYLRKPEVFKMACLRDIMSLFNKRKSPFYAGFGNRLTDALSYRSVNIPSTRIFTINSNAEVSLDLLSLNKYKTGYTSMRETVDHFFPPTAMLIQQGGEDYTDFNYWRDKPPDLDQFSDSGSDAQGGVLTNRLYNLRSTRIEDDDSDDGIFSDELGESSYLSRDSLEDSARQSMQQSIEEADLSGERMSALQRIGETDLEVDHLDEDQIQDLDALDLVAAAAGPDHFRRLRAPKSSVPS